VNRSVLALKAAQKRRFPLPVCHLYIKMMILPRQARDKHRENSKKEWRFPHRDAVGIDPAETPPFFLLLSCSGCLSRACLGKSDRFSTPM
jgi:hypothetical protein